MKPTSHSTLLRGLGADLRLSTRHADVRHRALAVLLASAWLATAPGCRLIASVDEKTFVDPDSGTSNGDLDSGNTDDVGIDEPTDDTPTDDTPSDDAGTAMGDELDAATDGTASDGGPDAPEGGVPDVSDAAVVEAGANPDTDDAAVSATDSGAVELEAGVDASVGLEEAGRSEAAAPRAIFVGRGPSCANLQPICGPDANEHCCEVFEVEAGQFSRGDNEGWPSERPEHPASVDSFWLDRYEVSVGRFAAFQADYLEWHDTLGNPQLNSGEHPKNPGSGWYDERWFGVLPRDANFMSSIGTGTYRYEFATDSGVQRERLPVSGVNWFMAFAFCIWDGGRLPTEAEREYAGTGPEGLRYPWGNSGSSGFLQEANADCSRDGYPDDCWVADIAPVGSYPLGRGPFGHDDLAGNVREWVVDYYDPEWYLQFAGAAACDNCIDIGEGKRGLRGGSFDSETNYLRNAARLSADPEDGLYTAGFRCAYDAAPTSVDVTP